jgi:uncharacterized membrane protein YadS
MKSKVSTFFLSYGRGFVLPIILTILSFIIAPFTPVINTVMWGFILGLILGNTYKIPDNQKAGIDYTASKLLEVSIIFLAFSKLYSLSTNRLAKYSHCSYSDYNSAAYDYLLIKQVELQR